MDLVEEIKNRLNIVELAVQLGLKPNGSDFIFSIYKSERNRSLKLYEKTNSFYCFSKGKGGDVINFYADFKKIDCKEAISILGKELGLNGNGKSPHSGSLPKGESEAHQNSSKKNIEIYHSFEKYCDGIDCKALRYLTGNKRGLTEKSIKKFRLFSIKDLNGAIDFLISSFHLYELKASGLFNESGRFVFRRHRIIIPYLEDDKIIYLRGRVFPDQDNNETGRYVGLYGQSAKRLFNLDALRKSPAAKAAASFVKGGLDVLLCEGEFDAIRADQEGIAVVGVPGVNNFPDDGKEMLERFNIYICFDNDAAGIEGMQRVVNVIGRAATGLYLLKHKDITEYFNITGKKELAKNEYVEVKEIEPFPDEGHSEVKNRFTPITAKQLQNMKIPPIRWVIEGLLPEGLTMLAGKPKSGKSWMALCMAIDVAKEARVLNKFKSVKSTVLYIALEDSCRRMQDRTNNITGADYEKSLPDNLLLFTIDDDFPKLNETGLEVINSLLEEHKDLRFIIIDTFGRSIKDVHRRNKNIYLADYELMSSIQRFSLDKRIAFLLIHHTKKGKEDHPFDEISGTTGITGALDTMMVIKKDRGKTFLHISGRDVIDAEYPIHFDINSYRWIIADEKPEQNLTAERQEIIEMFKKYKRRMKTGEVAELLGKEKSNVSKLLKKLVDDKILCSPGYGVYSLIERIIFADEEKSSE